MVWDDREDLGHKVSNVCVSLKETLSDAFENNINAGKTDHPVTISWRDNILNISDLGEGFSPEDIEKLSQESLSVGLLSILTLNESFLFITCAEGIKYEYEINREKTVRYSLKSQEPTDEIGNAVCFNVEEDIVNSDDFLSVLEVNTSLAFCPCEFDFPPSIKFCSEDYRAKRGKFKFYNDQNFAIKGNNNRRMHHSLCIKVGHVVYGVSRQLCNVINSHIDNSTFFNSYKFNFCFKVDYTTFQRADETLVLFLNEDEIELSDSKQTIEYSSNNLAVIEKRLCQASTFLLKQFSSNKDNWSEIEQLLKYVDCIDSSLHTLLISSKTLKYKDLSVVDVSSGYSSNNNERKVNKVNFFNRIPDYFLDEEGNLKYIPYNGIIISERGDVNQIQPLYFYNGKNSTNPKFVPLVGDKYASYMNPSFRIEGTTSCNIFFVLSSSFSQIGLDMSDIYNTDWVIYKTTSDRTFPTPKLLKKYGLDNDNVNYIVYRYDSEDNLEWLKQFYSLGILNSLVDLGEVQTKSNPVNHSQAVTDHSDPRHNLIRSNIYPKPTRAEVSDPNLVWVVSTNEAGWPYFADFETVEEGIRRYHDSLKETFGFSSNMKIELVNISPLFRKNFNHIVDILNNNSKVTILNATDVVAELSYLYTKDLCERCNIEFTELSHNPLPYPSEKLDETVNTLKMIREFLPHKITNQHLMDILLLHQDLGCKAEEEDIWQLSKEFSLLRDRNFLEGPVGKDLETVISSVSSSIEEEEIKLLRDFSNIVTRIDLEMDLIKRFVSYVIEESQR